MKKSKRLKMIEEICLARRDARLLELAASMPSDEGLQDWGLIEWFFAEEEAEPFGYEPIWA